MIKTKIIVTLGPATFSTDIICNLLEKGMNVVRINMSHEIHSDKLEHLILTIRKEADRLDRSVSVLFDLCGPKVRIGKINSNNPIKIEKGSNYSIGYKDCDILLNIPLVFSEQSSDAQIKVDDGNLNFNIIKYYDNKLELEALSSGIITQGKGVNFPGIQLDIPPLTKKDIIDIELAAKLGVDWLAMSFVQSSNDINLIKDKLSDLNTAIPVIAKIEKPEAIENLGSIIQSFDGVLVARGDLGVETPIQQLPILQKRIVNECLQKQKPVIIATQMLETMIHNQHPTRAEVNDIANAIYDGADAVMLSAETAIGKYPIESVQMMSDIAGSVEQDFDSQNFNRYMKLRIDRIQDNCGSICHAAMTIADDLSINTIVIMTESGQTAIKMAQYRPQANIYALCSHKDVYQMLSLVWGIIPILVVKFKSTDEMIQESGRILNEKGYLQNGEKFIITAGAPVGVTGTTNMIKIQTVS